MFIAGMREVQLVGTCEKLEDPEAPVWSAVHLENVEAIGAGTLLPHIHVSVGLKAQSKPDVHNALLVVAAV